MQVPQWALALSYWLHMLATVAWLGGLSAANMLTLPLIARIADPAERLLALQRTQKKLDPLGWFSLLLLTATGLVQMSASSRYEGFLSITNDWALAILLKHIVFFGMIGVSAFLTWKALPELSRAVLRISHGKGQAGEIDRIQKKHTYLLRANLALGLIVLVFTALARVAG